MVKVSMSMLMSISMLEMPILIRRMVLRVVTIPQVEDDDEVDDEDDDDEDDDEDENARRCDGSI